MNRSKNVSGAGYITSLSGPATPPGSNGDALREKREQQQEFRQRLNNDAVTALPTDRKAFQRKPLEKVDVGLCIGNTQTKSEKALEKKANQAAYRQMLDDSKLMAPVTGDRKRFGRKSSSSPNANENSYGEQTGICIGEVSEASFQSKRQDAIDYRNQLQRDIQLKKEREAEMDVYDKSSMNGLMIGSQKEEPAPRRGGGAARSHFATNNIFPSADAGSHDANQGHNNQNYNSNRSNRMQASQYDSQDSRLAPEPADDRRWGQKVAVQSKSKLSQYEDKYVNQAEFTGLCVGTEGNAVEKKADKSNRVEIYRSQLAQDLKRKAAVRNRELANQRCLD